MYWDTVQDTNLKIDRLTSKLTKGSIVDYIKDIRSIKDNCKKVVHAVKQEIKAEIMEHQSSLYHFLSRTLYL